LPRRLGNIGGISLSSFDVGSNLNRRLIESTSLTRSALQKIDELQMEFEGQIAKVVKTDTIVIREVTEIGEDIRLAGDIIFTGTTPEIRNVQDVAMVATSHNALTSSNNGFEWWIGGGTLKALQIDASGNVQDGGGNNVAFQGTGVSFTGLTLTGSPYIRTAEAAERATPPANTHDIYVDSADNTLKIKHASGTVVSLEDQGTQDAQYLTLANHADLTVERVFTPNSTLTGTDGGANSTYTLGINLTNANSWSAVQTFTAGTAHLDNDLSTYGTGSDATVGFDGTDFSFISNIPENTADQAAMWSTWAVETDQTGISAGAANRPFEGAQAIHNFGWTDAASARQTAWAIMPYQRGPNQQGPGIVTPLTNWFIGSHDGSKYTGIHKLSSTSLDFYFEDLKVFSASAAGLVIGGVSVATLRTVTTQRMRVQASLATAGTNLAAIEFEHNGNHTTAATAPFVTFIPKNGSTATRCLNVWNSGAALSTTGAGVGADQPFTYDDTNSGTLAQGNTYHLYDSGNSTFDTFVDAVEVTNASATKVTTVQDAAFSEGMSVDVETVTTTSATLGDDDYAVLCDDDTAGGAVTITLPAAASHTGRTYFIKKLGTTASITVDGNSSETIDGATTAVISTQYESIQIVCDGSNWHII